MGGADAEAADLDHRTGETAQALEVVVLRGIAAVDLGTRGKVHHAEAGDQPATAHVLDQDMAADVVQCVPVQRIGVLPPGPLPDEAQPAQALGGAQILLALGEAHAVAAPAQLRHDARSPMAGSPA